VNWTKSIEEAINYIEDNIGEDIKAEVLSEKVFSSQFYFQKMFTVICECTVSEYIRNRRMTLAGYEVVDETNSILDIALKYGYESNESFTRAFTRFHGITPSEARKTHCNLKAFSSINVKQNLAGGKSIMSDLSERGYVVKETGAVYYTKDMDTTLIWFENILGWFGQIESRDDEGNGNYGCVNNIPIEIEALHIAPFTGIHMFRGEPLQLRVGFMLVQGIEQLYQFVKKKGWNQITEVKVEPWGGKTCIVTTIDGSLLTFFE